MTEPTVIHEIKTNEKAVSITFDDGPDSLYTPQLLAILQEAGARATFFMVGSQAELHPDVARAVYAQGHEIGNHTYTHPHLTKLSAPECEAELARTEKLIQDTVGIKPRTFRPPYFDYNETVAGIARGFGYAVAGAVNGAARDWDQPGVAHIIGKTREALRPGAILLFHDGFGDRSQTVEAVRALVSELSAKGYKLVTVSELLALAANGVAGA